MTDAAIIDAYEHAYNTAQRYGADGRDNEMPPMRDRQTMAQRVRGYATQSKNGSTGKSAGAPTSLAFSQIANPSFGLLVPSLPSNVARGYLVTPW